MHPERRNGTEIASMKTKNAGMVIEHKTELPTEEGF